MLRESCLFDRIAAAASPSAAAVVDAATALSERKKNQKTAPIRRRQAINEANIIERIPQSPGIITKTRRNL